MPTRYDYSTAELKVSQTPTGGIRVRATPTRTGVLIYYNEDGSERREYRPPEEVFSGESLASLEGAALTIGHPYSGGVSPSNWKEHSVGFVTAGREAGSVVETDVLVQDAAAVGAVLGRELVELSCGYDCDLDATPGVTPAGERYDGVQRSIRYNHVALLPEGWARAGRDARLHLDSAHGSLPTMTLEQLQAALAAAEKRAAEATARADAAETRAGAAEARATAAEAETVRYRSDASDEAMEARVAARVALVQSAALVAPAVRCDGKSEAAILAECTGMTGSLEYLRGAFGVLVERARQDAVAGDNAARAALPDADGNARSDADDAREEFLKRAATAYTKGS